MVCKLAQAACRSPFWKLDATDSTVFLVACPATTCDITSYDTLDWKHIQFPAEHAVSIKLWLLEELRHILYIYGNHMVWKDVLCHIKPEF